MFLSFFNWCLCDFLVLKHINEVDALHLHLSFTDVDMNFNTAFDYLLMLTIFHVQNVLTILDWCLCDFLVLKHINEVDAFHLHLSFTDVDIFFVFKMFHNFNIAFDYLLMLTIFHVQNVLIIFDRCLRDFLVMKHIDQVDALHLHLSFTDVDMFQYCFWLFTDVDYFSCAKCSYHFSTNVYVIFWYWNILMKWMHFIFICHLLMLTYFLCGKYSTISILLLVIYWCWLFFMCKMFLSFLDWCLCDFLVLKHIDQVDALHLHLSFTDVDMFQYCF